MTLPIGNDNSRFFAKGAKKREGFSFIEVMATVVVLTSGIVFIYKAFFISLDYINHMTYRIYAVNLLNNRIATLERDLESENVLPVGNKEDIEKVTLGHKTVDFRYDRTFRNVEKLSNIYELTLGLSWREGSRDIRLSRSLYIANYKPAAD